LYPSLENSITGIAIPEVEGSPGINRHRATAKAKGTRRMFISSHRVFDICETIKLADRLAQRVPDT
jgi:hypothetical protein